MRPFVRIDFVLTMLKPPQPPMPIPKPSTAAKAENVGAPPAEGLVVDSRLLSEKKIG